MEVEYQPPRMAVTFDEYLRKLNIDPRLLQGMSNVQPLGRHNDDNFLLSPACWQGSSIWEHALCAVNEDKQGHLIFAGFASGSHAADTQLFLGKINPMTQAVIWGKVFHSQTDDEVNQIVVTDENNILLVGTSQCTSDANQQFLVMKFNPNGQLMFRHVYELPYPCFATSAVIKPDDKSMLIMGTTHHSDSPYAEQHGLQVNTINGAIEWTQSPRTFNLIQKRIQYIADQVIPLQKQVIDETGNIKPKHFFVGQFPSVVATHGSGYQPFKQDNIDEIIGEFAALMEQLPAQSQGAAAALIDIMMQASTEIIQWLVGSTQQLSKWILQNLDLLKLIRQARVRESVEQSITDGQKPINASYQGAHQQLGLILRQTVVAAQKNSRVQATSTHAEGKQGKRSLYADTSKQGVGRNTAAEKKKSTGNQSSKGRRLS